jgi:hypothetical protein
MRPDRFWRLTVTYFHLLGGKISEILKLAFRFVVEKKLQDISLQLTVTSVKCKFVNTCSYRLQNALNESDHVAEESNSSDSDTVFGFPPEDGPCAD